MMSLMCVLYVVTVVSVYMSGDDTVSLTHL